MLISMNNHLFKNILTFFLIVLLLLIVGPFNTPVYAHILLTDGSIGAVVHISPDDDPIVGENADFFFEFKDKDNKFQPQNCDCQYEIKSGNRIVASGDLFASATNPSLENASFSLIFPERGIYNLSITGTPKNSGDFNKFKLTDSIRIERTSQSKSTTQADNFFTSHYLHFFVFGAGIGIFLILLSFKIRKNP